jgi:hypothetical protein
MYIFRLLSFLSLIGLCLAKCEHFNVNSPWGLRAYTNTHCRDQKVREPEDEDEVRRNVKCKDIKHHIKSFHMVSRNGCYVDVWTKPNCDQDKKGVPRSAPYYSTYWGHQEPGEWELHWPKPSVWNSTVVNTKRYPVKSYRVYCSKNGDAVRLKNEYVW